jgi:hypothetical protein
MKAHPVKRPGLAAPATSLVKVSRKLMRERAVTLAVVKGRAAKDVSKSDWEKAKRELRGRPDVDPIQMQGQSAAERERWNPLSGSTGYKVHVPSGDDEDDEGRSDTERLVERGVRDAEREQMNEANEDSD